MLVTELNLLVTSCLSGNDFTLSNTALDSAGIRLVFKSYFPQGLITVKQAVLTQQADTTTVVGYLNTPFLGISNLKVKIRFSIGGQEPAILIEFSELPAGWQWSSFFPELADSIFDEFVFVQPVFTLDSQNSNPLAKNFQTQFGYLPSAEVFEDQLKQGLTFSGSVLAKDIPPSLAWVLAGEAVTSLALGGPIEIRNGVAAILLSEEATHDFELLGKKVPLSLQLVALNNTTGLLPARFGVIRANTAYSLGSQQIQLPLSAKFSSALCPLLMLEARPLSKAQPIKLQDLPVLIGLEQPQSFIPSDLPLLSAISLDRFGFVLNIFDKVIRSAYVRLLVDVQWKILNDLFSLSLSGLQFTVVNSYASVAESVVVSISGAVTVADKEIEASIFLPSLDFDFFLPEGETIEIKAMVEGLLGYELSMPRISCTQLVIAGNLPDKSFSLNATVTDDWAIEVAGTSLSVTEVQLQLAYSNGVASGRIYGKLVLGGTEFFVAADHSATGWTLEGGTTAGDVDITAFVTALQKVTGVPGPASLPSVTVQNLYMRYDSGDKSFAFNADVAGGSEITIGAGKKSVNARISLTSKVDPATAARNFTGFFKAGLTVADSILAIEYNFGEVEQIIGSWTAYDGERLAFQDFAHSLGITEPITLPDGLDFSLAELAFRYNAQQNAFTLSARSLHYGDAFFTTAKGSNNSLGVIFGANLPASGKFSAVPVIGPELKAADFIVVNKLAFMYSSVALPSYTIPMLPPLTTSRAAAAAGTTAPPVAPMGTGATVQLSPGLSMLAEVSLGGGSDKKMSALNSLVEENTLLLQVATTPGAVKLFAGLRNFSIPAPNGGKLVIPDAGLQIDIGAEIVFQLSGRMSLTLNGKQIDALVRLVLDESEAQVAFAIQSDSNSLPPFPGVSGLHLKQFGLEMGVFFEPPGLDLGVQGKFSVGEQVSDDTFGIVLEVVEEVPNILYLSFYLESLDLGELVTLFTDQPEPDAVRQLAVVKASDLSFYFAENSVVLPDGTLAQPGFKASATLQILGFGAHGNFSIDAAKGITGLATMAPVNINNVLTINGDGQAVKRNYVVRNGQKVGVANNQVVRQGKAALPVQTETVVAAGGPVIAINTLGSPYFHLDWDVSLFDLLHEKVSAEIDNSGIRFALSYNLAGIERVDMSCRLKDWSNFSAAANFNFGIDEQIGPLSLLGVDIGVLHLVADLKSSLAVVLNPSTFSISINGGFDFMGLHINLPDLVISVKINSLLDIVQKIIAKIIEKAEGIFAFIFNDVKVWANLMAKNVITGIDAVGDVLKNAYKLAGHEAVAVMKSMQNTADEAAAELREVDYAAAEIMVGLDSAYQLTAEEATVVLNKAGYAANEVGDALTSVYSLTAAQVASALHGAHYVADQVAGWTHGAADDVADWGTGAVNTSLGWTTGAADTVADWTKNAGKDSLNWTVGAGNTVANWAVGVSNTVAGTATNVGNQIAHTFNPTKW